MDYLEKLIGEIELHSATGISECFRNGVDPNLLYKNEPLLYELTSGYTRSQSFSDCVRSFVDAGVIVEHRLLLSVLLNDSKGLEEQLRVTPLGAEKKYTLRCAYTPLIEATLLHICAEFNLPACARVLIDHGIDVNAKAGFDEHGFGGQTPVFHTVNQNSNNSIEMLELLVTDGADLNFRVKGLIWGKGYEWETLIPAVNPISYAMMGLLPQMHRDERTISKIVNQLMKAAYGIDYNPGNVPNKYLNATKS
jgi:hypothetical protein